MDPAWQHILKLPPVVFTAWLFALWGVLKAVQVIRYRYRLRVWRRVAEHHGLELEQGRRLALRGSLDGYVVEAKFVIKEVHSTPAAYERLQSSSMTTTGTMITVRFPHRLDLKSPGVQERIRPLQERYFHRLRVRSGSVAIYFGWPAPGESKINLWINRLVEISKELHEASQAR